MLAILIAFSSRCVLFFFFFSECLVYTYGFSLLEWRTVLILLLRCETVFFLFFLPLLWLCFHGHIFLPPGSKSSPVPRRGSFCRHCCCGSMCCAFLGTQSPGFEQAYKRWWPRETRRVMRGNGRHTNARKERTVACAYQDQVRLYWVRLPGMENCTREGCIRAGRCHVDGDVCMLGCLLCCFALPTCPPVGPLS